MLVKIDKRKKTERKTKNIKFAIKIEPQISKVFLLSLVQFFLTVGQNNFGNKIPFLDVEFLLYLHVGY